MADRQEKLIMIATKKLNSAKHVSVIYRHKRVILSKGMINGTW